MHRPLSPHVSPALAHLRYGVTLASAGLVIALLAQVFVWAFVHFTDVRVTQLESEHQQHSLRVVEGVRPAEIGSLSGISERAEESTAPEALAGPVSIAPGANAPVSTTGSDTSMNPNVVESAADRVLRAGASVVQSLGVVSAILLAVLLFNGVSVAAGGSVPGVENAVSGATLATFATLLAVPIVGLVPDAPFGGVFVSYDTLVADSAAVQTGMKAELPFYVSHVFMPLILVGVVGVALMKFRAGVEQGLISTSVSEAQERLEREIRSRKNLGAMANSRAMGAMNAAFDVGGVETAVGLPGPTTPAVHSDPPPAPMGQASASGSEGRAILPDTQAGRPI